MTSQQKSAKKVNSKNNVLKIKCYARAGGRFVERNEKKQNKIVNTNLVLLGIADPLKIRKWVC